MARAKLESLQRYPLDAILGTDATVRLLRELCRHGGMLSGSALVVRTGLAPATIGRGLASLERVGVTEMVGSGRTHLYRLRTDHPLASALHALFATEEARFATVLSSIKSATDAAGAGVKAVWLYGSVARGEDGINSDLDLALVTEPEKSVAVADALRDALVAPSEKLNFIPSLVALDTNDVRRLSIEQDPWWTSLVDDVVVIVGPRPEVLSMELQRAAPSRAAA